jgi:hypothetical protein
MDVLTEGLRDILRVHSHYPKTSLDPDPFLADGKACVAQGLVCCSPGLFSIRDPYSSYRLIGRKSGLNVDANATANNTSPLPQTDDLTRMGEAITTRRVIASYGFRQRPSSAEIGCPSHVVLTQIHSSLMAKPASSNR